MLGACLFARRVPVRSRADRVVHCSPPIAGPPPVVKAPPTQVLPPSEEKGPEERSSKARHRRPQMDFLLLAGLTNMATAFCAWRCFLKPSGSRCRPLSRTDRRRSQRPRFTLSGPLFLAGSLRHHARRRHTHVLLGRHTGWWLLSLLCRLSLNPESCILRSADSFYKRGRTLLIFAKFVPGINTMAPPLAGSMNMRFGQFLRRDAIGAALYIGAYWSLGFLFSDAVEPLRGLCNLSAAWPNGRFSAAVTRVSDLELAAGWEHIAVDPACAPLRRRAPCSTNGAVIRCTQPRLLQRQGRRIQGSLRLDPNAHESSPREMPVLAGRWHCSPACARPPVPAWPRKLIAGASTSLSSKAACAPGEEPDCRSKPFRPDEMAPLPVFD